MADDIQILQDLISPNIAGIIWPTKESLLTRPAPFVDLDYFMDGLLAKFHQQQINSSDTKSIKKHRQNFFISKNFGDNFFLGHIELHSDTDEDNINTLFSTINTFHRKDKQILIIEFGNNIFLNKIIKKFPEYNFKSIIYPFKLP